MTRPPRLNLRTTAQLIKQSSVSFISNFYTFLFLSLLLVSFKTAVETGTLFVTAFIDRDPSLKSLLSRLDLADKNDKSSSENFRFPAIGNRRRNRPFLHLTRFGTLDDDFFSSEDDVFAFGRKSSSINSSFQVNLSNFFHQKLGFSDLDKKEGIKFSFPDEEDVVKNEKEEEEDEEEGEDRVQFAAKGIERDAAALFFLVGFLSAAYGWLILGYLVIQSCVLGVVFLVVANNHLGKESSFFGTILAGSQLGFRRLSGFILIRWAVRDALTQFLGLWFFGEIEDQYSFLKLFVRLKLMPFSITSPWIQGFEKQILDFQVVWFMLDTFVSFVFAVDSWVAIMNTGMSSKEVVKEGCYLISLMFNQAVVLKGFEAVLCGLSVRWVLSRIFGRLFGSFFQSVAEVYFMVVWLIYYFAARCKDINPDGRRFGRRDLQNFIHRLR
ncbi:Transmembrane protein [Thalictrum thalictroides]|uniref:Transmembrane protein n=1 Tax=Thalictrum thalictroides TaxID=46969 RepID=A0A7J6WJD0_THATH|nr:Transmembrane protein [Thalictrum thalictroides]